jgi:hypothetical protein
MDVQGSLIWGVPGRICFIRGKVIGIRLIDRRTRRLEVWMWMEKGESVGVLEEGLVEWDSASEWAGW